VNPIHANVDPEVRVTSALAMPNPVQQVRVDLRAQRIYQRTAQVLAWGNVAETTRAEFSRRALAGMRHDGTLLNGTPKDEDDDGYAELVELDREADEVLRSGRR
jgi:hypothetical protein